MAGSSKKASRGLSSKLMYAMIAMSIASAANAATLTFTGGAGTQNFHDASNWDSNTVPTSADQLIIQNGSTVVLSDTAKIGSLEVQQGGSINVQSALEYVSGIQIQNGGVLTMLNGTLKSSQAPTTVANVTSYPTIVVDGNLEMKGDSTISGATSTSPSTVLTINKDGKLTITGSNNKLVLVKVNVKGEMKWGIVSTDTLKSDEVGQDLVFDKTTIEVIENGKAGFNGVSLQLSDSADTISAIQATLGEISFDGTAISETNGAVAIQSIDVPVTVQQGSTISSIASSQYSNFVRFNKDVSIDGDINVSNHSQFVLGEGNHNISSTCKVSIEDSSAIYFEGGQTSWAATVNSEEQPSGSIVVQAPADVIGSNYLSELFILGGKLSVGLDSIATSHNPVVKVSKQMYMDSGEIIGAGEGNARSIDILSNATVTIDGAEAPDSTTISNEKKISNLQFNLGEASTFTIAKDAVLLLDNTSELTVGKDGLFILTEGSKLGSIDSTTDNPAIKLNEGSILRIKTGESPIEIETKILGEQGSVEIVSSGLGSSEDATNVADNVVFSNVIEPKTLTIQDNQYAKISFTCKDASSANNIPASIQVENGDIELNNCTATTSEETNWNSKNLYLKNTSLGFSEGGSVKIGEKVIIGTEDGDKGIVSGSGKITSNHIDFYAGDFNADTLDISGILRFLTSNTKTIGTKTLSVLAGGTVQADPESIVIFSSDESLWNFSTGSKFVLGAGSRIASIVNPTVPSNTTTDGESVTYTEDDIKGIRPQIWLDKASMIIGDETGENDKVTQIDVFVRNSGGSIQTYDKSKVVFTNGIIGEDEYGSPASDSTTTIGSESTLELGSNHGLPLIPGSINGTKGVLQLGKGPFKLTKPVQVGAISIVEGAYGTIAQNLALDETTGLPIVDPTNPDYIEPTAGNTDLSTNSEEGTTNSTFETDVCETPKWLGSDPVSTSWGLFGSTIFLGLLSAGLGSFIVYKQFIEKKKDEDDMGPNPTSIATSGSVESRQNE